MAKSLSSVLSDFCALKLVCYRVGDGGSSCDTCCCSKPRSVLDSEHRLGDFFQCVAELRTCVVLEEASVKEWLDTYSGPVRYRVRFDGESFRDQKDVDINQDS